MSSPIVIVPGKNMVLNYVARQMGGVSDVIVLGSANEVLWQARQNPPRVVVADVQLADMSGAELAEILPNFAPNTRILICGQATPAAIAQMQAFGAEFVALGGSTAEAVRQVYEALDMAPPPMLPSTGELQELAAPPAARVAAAPPRETPPPAETPAPVPAPARSRPPQVAPSQPAPEAPKAPARTPVPDATFTGSGALVIQPQQSQMLVKLLDLVNKEVGAQAVLLIDPAGMVLVRSGTLPGVVMELIGPMIATSFSTTTQLARQLSDQNTTATYIHEGDIYDIYAFNVAGRVTLLIMFDKRINPGKLGTVWVYAKRALRQLGQILKL